MLQIELKKSLSWRIGGHGNVQLKLSVNEPQSNIAHAKKQQAGWNNN